MGDVQKWVKKGEDMWTGPFKTTPSSGSTSSSSYETFLGGPEAKAGIMSQLGNIDSTFANAIKGGEEGLNLARDLAFGPGGNLQYSQAARRMSEELLPKLSAMGLTTSGPGVNILSQKLGELGISQQAKGVELLQQASQGLALLQAMPVELRGKFLQMLLSKLSFGSSTGTQTGTQPSLWSDVLGPLGGGSGLSNLAKM